MSVQSVVADAANRLWILDTAAPNFTSPVPGGAKLVAIDLATNKIVKTICGVAAQRSSYVFASAVASANERATLDQIGFDHP